MYTKIIYLGQTKIYYYRNNYNYIISNGIHHPDKSILFKRAIASSHFISKIFGIQLKKTC
jgi:hypothetical protein